MLLKDKLEGVAGMVIAAIVGHYHNFFSLDFLFVGVPQILTLSISAGILIHFIFEWVE